MVWFQTVFLTRREIYCKKQRVSLRNGIAFVVVTVAVLNTFSGYFRNGLCCRGVLDVFSACNKLSPESTYQNDRQQSWRKWSSHSTVECRKNYLSDVFLRIPIWTHSFPWKENSLLLPDRNMRGLQHDWLSHRKGIGLLCCAVSILWKKSSLSYVWSSQFITVNSDHWTPWFSHNRDLCRVMLSLNMQNWQKIHLGNFRKKSRICYYSGVAQFRFWWKVPQCPQTSRKGSSWHRKSGNSKAEKAGRAITSMLMF